MKNNKTPDSLANAVLFLDEHYTDDVTLVYDILINCTFYKSYDIIQTRQSEGPLYEIHA
jgi:hypothetical protein